MLRLTPPPPPILFDQSLMKFEYSLNVVTAVSYGNEYYEVFKQAIFMLLSAWRKGGKSVTGHERDKLIKSYSAQPTIDYRATVQVIFHCQVINNSQTIPVSSTCSYSRASLVFLPFLSMTTSASHHPQQQS